LTKELELLQLYVLLHQQHLELEQLQHKFASHTQEPFGVSETLEALHTLGFDARIKKGLRQSLRTATLPALMPTNDGSLMLVGEILETTDPDGTVVLLQKAGQGIPNQVTLQEFDHLFAGEWIEAKPSIKLATYNQSEAAANQDQL
jgi:ABC-type bacteriocin/lantibiotic exporter with double-glycine peptidase domain